MITSDLTMTFGRTPMVQFARFAKELPVRIFAGLVSIALVCAGEVWSAVPDSVHEAGAEGPGHASTVLPILLGLVVIIAGARIGGSLFSKVRQPPVLGELVVGIILGNLGLLGFHGLDGLRQLGGIELLAEIGVLFLLFEVGLHSNQGQLLAVGASSLLVATVGVIAPMVLGYLCSALFFPGHSGQRCARRALASRPES